MLITPAELDILVAEHARLDMNHEYRSAALYRVVAAYVFAHICRKGWLRYPSDVKEALELDCVVRAYRELPKYDRARGAAQQRKYNRQVNHAKALYRHLEVIVSSTCLNTFARLQSKHMRSLSLSADDGLDLAAVPTEDVDARIDADRRAARERTFNERLDMIEAILSAKTKARKRHHGR